MSNKERSPWLKLLLGSGEPPKTKEQYMEEAQRESDARRELPFGRALGQHMGVLAGGSSESRLAKFMVSNTNPQVYDKWTKAEAELGVPIPEVMWVMLARKSMGYSPKPSTAGRVAGNVLDTIAYGPLGTALSPIAAMLDPNIANRRLAGPLARAATPKALGLLGRKVIAPVAKGAVKGAKAVGKYLTTPKVARPVTQMEQELVQQGIRLPKRGSSVIEEAASGPKPWWTGLPPEKPPIPKKPLVPGLTADQMVKGAYVKFGRRPPVGPLPWSRWAQEMPQKGISDELKAQAIGSAVARATPLPTLEQTASAAPRAAQAVSEVVKKGSKKKSSDALSRIVKAATKPKTKTIARTTAREMAPSTTERTAKGVEGGSLPKGLKLTLEMAKREFASPKQKRDLALERSIAFTKESAKRGMRKSKRMRTAEYPREPDASVPDRVKGAMAIKGEVVDQYRIGDIVKLSRKGTDDLAGRVIYRSKKGVTVKFTDGSTRMLKPKELRLITRSKDLITEEIERTAIRPPLPKGK